MASKARAADSLDRLKAGELALKKRDHPRLKLSKTYALLIALLFFSSNDVLVHDFVVVFCSTVPVLA